MAKSRPKKPGPELAHEAWERAYPGFTVTMESLTNEQRQLVIEWLYALVREHEAFVIQDRRWLAIASKRAADLTFRVLQLRGFHEATAKAGMQ